MHSEPTQPRGPATPTPTPSITPRSIPATRIRRLSRDQSRAIDRLALERYHIPGIVLMENAARAVADAALDVLADHPGNALIVCGGGNNGGDGLAAARHLHNAGVEVEILRAIDPARYSGDAAINWRIVSAMGLPSRPADPASISDARPALIVDALLGTGLSAPPRDPYPRLIESINRAADEGAKILCVDLPSGMDAGTGIPPGVCVRATRTITFVAQKAGFANPASKAWTGAITVASIGAPPELLDELE
jgi:NAD(P)H-hydrate epimerase